MEWKKSNFCFINLCLILVIKQKLQHLEQDHQISSITPENDYKAHHITLFCQLAAVLPNMMIKIIKCWCRIGPLNYVYRTGYDVAY